MKTAKEFAKSASNEICWNIGNKRDVSGLLEAYFEEALDQSLQWQDGQPKKDGRYLGEVGGEIRHFWYTKNYGSRNIGEDNKHILEPVKKYIGPIPDSYVFKTRKNHDS